MFSVDVTVIIPTFNRVELVPDALESCLTENNLNDLRLQIVVADDCSTDNTLSVLKSYGERITVVALDQNGGQCRARNEGLKCAAGRYVKFLDSDDVLVPGVLTEEVRLAERERADIVVTGWTSVKLDRKRRTVASSSVSYPAPNMHPIPDTILLGRAVPTSAALYKKKYLEGLMWDSNIKKLDDWDWFCQAALRGGKIVSLDKASYIMRGHEGERVTKASMLINALDFYAILSKIEKHLINKDELTDQRKKRLAQYYYKELRVACLFEGKLFEDMIDHIYFLDKNFVPKDEERKKYMRIACRILGTRKAIRLHSFLKQKLKGTGNT